MTAITRAARVLRPPTLITGSVLAVSAAIAAAETFKLPLSASAPGQMVLQKFGGLHVSRRAGDGPTVVFENGLCTPLTTWGWMAQRLPEDTSFLSYDRPGAGWSHAAPAFWRREYPSALFELLRLMNVKPPLVLVGHSVGGLLIRMFAERYPNVVGGLVFVDPSPPRQYEQPEAVEGLDRYRDDLARLTNRSRLRLPLPSSWTSPVMRLPDPLGVATVKAMNRTAALRTGRREADLSASDWASAAARLTSTPVPVALVTSGATQYKQPHYATLVEEIAGLSETTHIDVVDDADHMTLLCDRGYAARVSDAIAWALANCLDLPAEDATTEHTLTEATR